MYIMTKNFKKIKGYSDSGPSVSLYIVKSKKGSLKKLNTSEILKIFHEKEEQMAKEISLLKSAQTIVEDLIPSDKEVGLAFIKVCDEELHIPSSPGNLYVFFSFDEKTTNKEKRNK